MLITYKEFPLITFPVYPLPNDNWYSQDGLLFLNGEILDDRNQTGETLGHRRLQTPFKNLVPLRNSINSEIGIIKQYKPQYIDNAGKLFLYEKTKFVPLKYHKIKKVERKEVASLLFLHGIKFPFIVPRPPPVDCKWAGVLYLGKDPWLLYEYSEEKLKDTRRKV